MRGTSVDTPWERNGHPLLTPEGHTQLADRLVRIRDTRLPQIRPLLREAERDERLVAEFERLLDEAAALESLLSRARVLTRAPEDFDGRVDIGMRVHVRMAGEDFWVRPVHPDEAFLDDERISATSPLATSLIGARAGQTIWLSTPRGLQSCEVLEIEHSVGVG